MKKTTKIFSVTAITAAICALFAFGACAKDNEPENKDDDNNIVNTVVSEVFLNTAITADAAYAKECDQQGTVTPVTYDTRAYYVEKYYTDLGVEVPEIPFTKTMYVYTPYGYDESKQYNVLFLMHGGGESAGYWFAEGEDYEGLKDNAIKYAPAGNITQNVADNLIKEGKIEPLIIVAASLYCKIEEGHPLFDTYPSRTAEAELIDTQNFYIELRNDIMPLIQSQFSTYAESATDEGFAAARQHFGFIGFSRGSQCTYGSIWSHCLDRFAFVGNLSEGTGKDWVLDYIVEKITEGDFKDLDIGFYYAACGEWDQLINTSRHAYDSILAARSDLFSEGDDITKGNNCWFNTHLEGGHEYRCWVADLYNCLQVFFK